MGKRAAFSLLGCVSLCFFISFSWARTLVLSSGGEPTSLDLHKTTSAIDFRIHRDLFEGLVIHDDKGGIVPGQAESWTVSDDGRLFTFNIRKDARWSNGDSVTAHDFVYSWRRLVNPETASPYAWYLEAAMVAHAPAVIRGKMPVEKLGVKAIDDKVFQVQLSEPLPYFIYMLTMMNLVPLHQKTVEQWGKDWVLPEHMISNGAYTLKGWVVNEKVEVVRNPHYWNHHQTAIEKVVFVPLEGTVELSRYKAGDIHLTYGVPAEHYPQLEKERPEELKSTYALGTVFVALNNKEKSMSNPLVRRSLSYAIDRSLLAHSVIGLGVSPAYTLTPPAVQGFQVPVVDYQTLPMDIRRQESRKLLAEAGYGPTRPLEVELIFQSKSEYKKLAVAISQMWKQIGVNTRLTSVEVGGYNSLRATGKFQALIGIWNADYNEASTMLNIMTSGHSSNHSRYQSTAFDQLIINSRFAQDEKVRNQIYSEAELQLARDVPLIPLYHSSKSFLIHPDLLGYPMNNPKGTVYSHNLYWKSGDNRR